MDIFKLGDKILDLLNVIFAFWNNQVSLVFALLGQSPTAFKDGKPWDGAGLCGSRLLFGGAIFCNRLLFGEHRHTGGDAV